MFCTGDSMTFSDIAAVRAASRRMVVVLAVTTITLPAFAWLASQLVNSQALRGGVLAAGVAPSEVATVALAGMAGGEAALAAGLLVASTVLTVLLAGPILSRLGAHSTTSQIGLLTTLALIVALPLLAGSATRSLDPFSGREQTPLRILGTASLLALLWEVASELQLRASDARPRRRPAALPRMRRRAGMATRHRRPGQTAPCHLAANRHARLRRGSRHRRQRVRSTRRAAPLGIYGILVLIFGTVAVYLVRRHQLGS